MEYKGKIGNATTSHILFYSSSAFSCETLSSVHVKRHTLSSSLCTLCLYFNEMVLWLGSFITESACGIKQSVIYCGVSVFSGATFL